MESLKSKLLVASPKLPDDNFYKSVIYLIQHDEEGAFGVILNRPSNFPLKEVWHAITEQECPCNSPIFLGGPVEGPLIAFHDVPECGESEIIPGVFMSSQKESLDCLLTNDCDRLKVFSGYSGWGAGQLECELETGSWFHSAATSEDIFCCSEDLWKHVAGRIGNRIVFQNESVSPFDPSMN